MLLIPRIIINMLCYMVILCQYFIAADENSLFLYNDIENCKNSEYFDIDLLKCKLCDINLNLIPANDKLSCICNRKSEVIREFDNVSKLPMCKLKCTNNSTAIPNCKDIPPPATAAEIICSIKLIQQINTNVPQTIKSIEIIKLKNNTANIIGNCSCNLKTHTLFKNEYCIERQLFKEYLNLNFFNNHHYHQLIYINLNYLQFLCEIVKLSEFCQYLANLCILSNYNVIDRNSACQLFYATQTVDILNGNLNSNLKTTPFLFYKKGKTLINELDKVLDYSYDVRTTTTNKNGNIRNNIIRLILIAFNLEGKLIKLQKFEINDLNLCGEINNDGSPFEKIPLNDIKFKQSFTINCQINIKKLIRFGELNPYFYSLYINYTENDINLMKIIPIRIKNLNTLNLELNREKWQLVKRFYLIDIFTEENINYKQKLYNDNDIYTKYRQIKYIKNIELNMHLHEDHNKYNNKITVPLMNLVYEHVNTTQLQYNNGPGNLYVNFQFKLTFTKNYDLNSPINILTTIFIIIGFGLTIFQTFCYKIKQQQEYFDSNIFNRSIIYLLSNISNALFSVIIVIICYIFIIYKTQEIVKILLPIHERVILQIYLYIAILLKFIKILHDIWIQSNIDIFFIDWERPKIAENQINLRTNLDTPSISSGGKNLIYEGISAWRNYFIANEWLKLTIQRKFSMFMQIILVSVIVISWNPKNNGNNVETDDPILNLAIGIIIYTLTYVILRLFNNLIYERFIKNSIHQFIDICSLGNISVFILSQQCYGYYVHGRSPHGFSDTDMCSMLLQLKREENNMSGQRGLIPNSVQQTYTFLAPINLRLLYDKLIIPFQQQLKCTTDNNHQQIIDFHNNSKYYGSKLDKIASTYYNINRFLCAFIDHGLKDLNYIIQDRSFIEIILNFVFGQNVTDNCGIFYTDSGHSFDKVLFYGNDFTLFQLELMIFLLVIDLVNNFIIALLIVGIVWKIIQLIMENLAKHNLSNKTLIDKSFLL